jgi:hypothetical protein
LHRAPWTFEVCPSACFWFLDPSAPGMQNTPILPGPHPSTPTAAPGKLSSQTRRAKAKCHQKWGKKAGLLPKIHHLLPLNLLARAERAHGGHEGFRNTQTQKAGFTTGYQLCPKEPQEVYRRFRKMHIRGGKPPRKRTSERDSQDLHNHPMHQIGGKGRKLPLTHALPANEKMTGVTDGMSLKPLD